MRKSRKAVVVGIVAALAVSALALPAAAEITRCNNQTLTGETITGELRVPQGATCVLDDVTVEGFVLVAANANLFAFDTTVTGNVEVRADGYAEFDSSDVHGDVIGRTSFGHLFVDSQLRGDIRTTRSLLVLVLGSDVGGVSVTGGVRGDTEVLVDGSRVDGSVITRASAYTDVVDSTIRGGLEVEDAIDGAIVCTSEVDNRIRIGGGGAPVQLGVGGGCETNVVGGDLVVTGVNGAPEIDDTVVRGDLRCQGNTTAPAIGSVRVRGETLGQCASVAGLSAQSRSAEAGPDTSELRATDARRQLEQRREAAGR